MAQTSVAAGAVTDATGVGGGAVLKGLWPDCRWGRAGSAPPRSRGDGVCVRTWRSEPRWTVKDKTSIPPGGVQ